jgi:hypothetical protein
MELRPYEDQTPRKRGTGYFWWSLLLMLMAGACFASWLGSFYVVAHPEIPECYKLLKKFKRLDPPKRFPVTEAPRGEFLTPVRLLERFGKMGPAELEHENAELLRAYIMNYRESKQQVVYVTGKYDVVETFPLGPKDFFPTGVALISQSVEQPQFVLELMFPTPPKTVPTIQKLLPIGSDLALERSRDLLSLVHVERLKDGRMQFTAIPLPYGGMQVKGNKGGFRMQSPEELEKIDPKAVLNIEAGLPIVRGERLAKGLDAYSEFRRKSLASASGDQATLAAAELVRFDPLPVQSVATVGSAPPPTQMERESARLPTEASAPTPKATATTPSTTPRPLPTPAPAAPLPPRPVVRAVAPPPLPAPVASTPPPTPAPAPPVQPIPAAADRRSVTTAQASAMVEQFKGATPTVLTGEFVVTGVLGQRVALRTRESLRDSKADPTLPGTNAALIVVDFPPGTSPPAKDTTLTRTPDQAFLIRDVIRQKNGQITIVAMDQSR